MENIITIIICSFIVLSCLLFLSFPIYLTWNKFITTPKEEAAIKRLVFSLKSMCDQLNIPLTYHDDLGTAAGKIVYHSNGAGQFLLDDAAIMILNACKNEPWVLAHELGHYMALKHNDRTEKSADAQALILCKSILTQKEQKLLDISLRCYFEK